MEKFYVKMRIHAFYPALYLVMRSDNMGFVYVGNTFKDSENVCNFVNTYGFRFYSMLTGILGTRE